MQSYANNAVAVQRYVSALQNPAPDFLMPLTAHASSPWSPYDDPPYVLWWVRLVTNRSARKQNDGLTLPRPVPLHEYADTALKIRGASSEHEDFSLASLLFEQHST